MTTQELKDYFHNTYGRHKQWPAYFEVDAETYANVCQDIFNHHIETYPRADSHVYVALGPRTNGIMFKMVELILVNK